ncbi:guanylate kinase [Plasmodiophora brassicae]|uniref:guanylate kinase n=1 Tax=Plasmodiophora brassicae TaxID=37360 RepID=A0A0G4J793_PLABS|nr:hypothetical protein PBRA_003220 [Plasmodiophora brassicae]SPQ95691.1 unnamed protein product [Plasmodiophora brassicae]
MAFRPLVVCGPSGVGKGTLIKKLLEQYPNGFGHSVSHTTRKPRAGEVDGVSYHFVEKSAMEKMIAENKFVEHANVHGNLYGSSITSVQAVQKQQKICLLEIDVQGAKQVYESRIPAHFLFIDPPHPQTLRERLIKRGSENDESIALRLKNAKSEMEFGKAAGFFEHHLVNDDLDTAFRELVSVVTSWYPHLETQATA